MNDNHSVNSNWNTLLDNFAAELTSAAYAIALRHGADKWLYLELELWGTLKETVKKLPDEEIRSLRPVRISNDHAH